MNDNKTNPGSAVAALQREIKTRTEVVRAIADLEEQLDVDRICGSWLSTENRFSAVIRRLGSGMWRAVVYDHALCYKCVVQEGLVTLRRHRLWLGADEGSRIVYDAASDTLTIGCYGSFAPEDTVAVRNDDAIPAEEYPFNE
ncbi:hypothetical protein [uncultured Alistipes sp.]|uniref:hypothetical protein n=1 Tax=uncultured Alistipes sp. TaxID=538949 RepID=UPI0027313C5B|nr:hypothetical protein [uncultured Alistipes sp.]